MNSERSHRIRASLALRDEQGELRSVTVVSVLGAIAIACCARFLFTWDGLLYTRYGQKTDLIQEYYPWRLVIHRAIEAGALPVWDPHVFSGGPVLSNIQNGLFYPLNLLFFVLPINVAFNWGFAILLFIAGISTYALLREYEISTLGSLVGAVAFMLGDAMTSRVLSTQYPLVATLAFVPAVFLAYEWALVRKTAWSRALPGVFVAFQFLGGYVQGAYLTLVAVFVYVVVRRATDFRHTPLAATKDLVALFGLSGVVAFLLTAVQLLPTVYASQFAIRSGGFSYRDMSYLALDPPLVLSAVMPNLFEGLHAYPWAYGFYVGIPTLILAAFAISRIRGDVRLVAITAVGVVSLLLAFGPWTPVYWLYYTLVPGADLFRAPNRFVVFVALSLSVLAGVGFDVVRYELVTVGRRAWELVGLLVVGQLAVVVALASLFRLGLAAVIPLPIPKADAIETLVDGMLLDAGFALLLTLLTVGILVGMRRRPDLRAILGVVLVALVVGNLLVVQAPELGSRPVAEIYADDELIYSDLPEGSRVYDTNLFVEDHWYSGGKSAFLFEEVNTVYGVETLGGFNPLNLGVVFERYDALAVGPAESEALLDASGVTHIIVDAADAPAYLATGNYSVAFELSEAEVDAMVEKPENHNATVVLRNDDTLGRAYFVPGSSLPDLTDAAVVDSASTVALERDADSFAISGEFAEAGYVVVSENHYPLWVATVDGERVTLEQTDTGFMAVPVEAGAQEISIDYDAWPSKLGAELSLVGLVLVGWLWRRDRRLKRAAKSKALGQALAATAN